MHHKKLMLCAIVLFVLIFSHTVYAQELDLNKSGSISVTLMEQYEKKPIADVELSVYYVATVHMNMNGNLNYEYTDSFKESGIDMDDLSFAAKLDTFVSQNNITSIKMVTDEKGIATCKNLKLGLYFIRQTDFGEEGVICTPFVVTVPSKNDEGYVYEVNASPKSEVVRLTSISIKKVWNTDEATQAVDNVTVQLLKRGNVVKTATLNAQNNWQVVYNNMPASDAYSIREVNVPKGFTATYSQEGYYFTVTNTPSLAQTGQLVWPIPVLAICGVLLIGVGVVLLQKKRETNA